MKKKTEHPNAIPNPIPWSAKWRRYQGKTAPLMVRITAEERERWTAAAKALEFYNVQAWIAYLCNQAAEQQQKAAPLVTSRRRLAR